MADVLQKTHTERKHPQMSVRLLADYMGASRQASRKIARDAKYRPTVRVIHHQDARRIISNFLADPQKKIELLHEGIESLKAKICDTPFEHDLVRHNCDYLLRFIKIFDQINLPDAQFHLAKEVNYIDLNGMRVSVFPELYLTRLTRRNTVKTGAKSIQITD